MTTTRTDSTAAPETLSFLSAVRRIEALTQEIRREGLGAFEKAEAAHIEVQDLRACWPRASPTCAVAARSREQHHRRALWCRRQRSHVKSKEATPFGCDAAQA